LVILVGRVTESVIATERDVIGPLVSASAMREDMEENVTKVNNEKLRFSFQNGYISFNAV